MVLRPRKLPTNWSFQFYFDWLVLAQEKSLENMGFLWDLCLAFDSVLTDSVWQVYSLMIYSRAVTFNSNRTASMLAFLLCISEFCFAATKSIRRRLVSWLISFFRLYDKEKVWICYSILGFSTIVVMDNVWQFRLCVWTLSHNISCEKHEKLWPVEERN